MEYLGHIIRPDGLSPMQTKVTKIRETAGPCTKRQLNSFLGLAGYYRKFIPHFATQACPLTDLTKKRQPNQLEWEEEQELAFNNLKRHLSTSPVLLLPDVKTTFTLRTDASNIGLETVLLQEADGVKRLVAIASRKLMPREKNYSTI
ncbi:hypothetical protein Pcinc_001303 [Petrolisthes cinctipes]|uniref:Reverse transcriptase/retrotransposon-derived protein RNase H-like domain-containing protein n=1 Tax=Petrolisthes cinctipes TaxID=88211 RepID=A0AAE1GN55_PETCI|nr:hypothetical protein Pcinc_001303 [Petrolisthes cinctipes]